MSKKTLIFVPTYNERNNVEPMCERLCALGLDADILFMDDSSPDSTGEVLEVLARRHPRVSVVHRASKAGVGSAHQDGIALAYDRGYERLVTLDADFTHTPEAIPRLLAVADSADVVVGSRFIEDGGLEGWTFIRKSLTLVGHTLTKHLLGMAHDATGAFRVYDLTAIPRGLFELAQSRGYSFFFESLYILDRNGMRIAQVPVTLPARTQGHSKMTPLEVGRSVQRLVATYVGQRVNPSRFQLKGNPEIDPALREGEEWNDYWNNKSDGTLATYDMIATIYRNAFIKPRLEQAIEREFSPGARLLHAGCGTGQVDVGLHGRADITAVDISAAALRVYLRENPGSRVKHASIFDLPFADASFDGAYNMGVVEHFTREEINRAFRELHRVIRPGGKMILFWPHAQATSVKVIGAAHWMLNDVLHRSVRFHPPEISLMHSKAEASALLASAGLELDSYTFGPKDLFVQAVVVARRPS